MALPFVALTHVGINLIPLPFPYLVPDPTYHPRYHKTYTLSSNALL